MAEVEGKNKRREGMRREILRVEKSNLWRVKDRGGIKREGEGVE